MIKKVRITRCLLWNYGWCLTLAASNILENSTSECMEKHPAHKELYDALIQSLFVDEDDTEQAAAGMGKSSKSGKSITVEEPNEEHVYDISLDVKENIIDEMGNVDEQPNGEAEPITYNSPKNDWFKQPLRPPTPDPQ
ncbi:hypothetical protein Tco_0144586 [Tanacetum coccineum]